jgi:hypothetical protein
VNPHDEKDQVTRHISFHWDGEHLFITTAQMQLLVEGADLLALTDLLSRHKEEISRHIQGLPAWVREEHQQYLDHDDVDRAT